MQSRREFLRGLWKAPVVAAVALSTASERTLEKPDGEGPPMRSNGSDPIWTAIDVNNDHADRIERIEAFLVID